MIPERFEQFKQLIEQVQPEVKRIALHYVYTLMIHDTCEPQDKLRTRDEYTKAYESWKHVRDEHKELVNALGLLMHYFYHECGKGITAKKTDLKDKVAELLVEM